MIPGTGCLRNSLGITDPYELDRAETDISLFRIYELGNGRRIDGQHDLRHLQAFDRFIFGDIYPWAGNIRTIDLFKGMFFCRSTDIADQSAKIFGTPTERGLLRDSPDQGGAWHASTQPLISVTRSGMKRANTTRIPVATDGRCRLPHRLGPCRPQAERRLEPNPGARGGDSTGQPACLRVW